MPVLGVGRASHARALQILSSPFESCCPIGSRDFHRAAVWRDAFTPLRKREANASNPSNQSAVMLDPAFPGLDPARNEHDPSELDPPGGALELPSLPIAGGVLPTGPAGELLVVLGLLLGMATPVPTVLVVLGIATLPLGVAMLPPALLPLLIAGPPPLLPEGPLVGVLPPAPTATGAGLPPTPPAPSGLAPPLPPAALPPAPIMPPAPPAPPSLGTVGPLNLHQLNLNRSSPLPVNTKKTSCVPLPPLTGQVVVVQDEAPDTSHVPSRGPDSLSRWISMLAPPLADATRASKEVTPSKKSTFFTLM